MASSKSSPGPHDRRPGNEREQCVKLTHLGKRCRRFAVGRSKLCKSHHAQVAAAQQAEANATTEEDPKPWRGPRRADGSIPDPPDPSPGDYMKGGIATTVKKQGLAKFVINEQARAALAKLGKADPTHDPRQTLLDTVNSAWRQRQVWEQMLATIPEDDWQYVGVTPVPGSILSAKGARIEAIQKHLGDATKAAARISKLAIDAGIEERLVRLAEEQSALIADTVRAGILAAITRLVAELRLSPAAQERALEAAVSSAATHLRLLAAGEVNEEGQLVAADSSLAASSELIEGKYEEVS